MAKPTQRQDRKTAEQATREEDLVMATVLALLASGRKNGFTASLLQAAIEGAEAVESIEVERIHRQRHRFGPCTS